MTASEDAPVTTPAAQTSPQGKDVVDKSSPAKAAANGEKASDKHKEALNHFVAGKRHLLVKDLEPAVTSLALACELLSGEFGEGAYECADAYYYYGKALLEMARAEAGVFGNALDGVPDGEDTDNSQVEDPEKMTEDERENVEKQVGEALVENFDALEERRKKKDSTGGETEEDDEEEEEAAAEGGEVAAKDAEGAAATAAEGSGEPAKEAAGAVENGEAKDSEPEKAEAEKAEGGEAEKDKEEVEGGEGEDKAAQEAEDEEDPSNLQLAWEMLELAKVAYTNKESSCTADEKKGVETKICETLLILGEVSLESENYEQAVADMTDCLNKRKVLHAEDSRRIAETNYHLGVALSHSNKFDEAVAALQDAIAVLKKRIENLRNKSESVDESKADDAFYTREGEITELEALIPEIEEKIQDTKDMKVQSASNQAEEAGFSKDTNGTEAKPISTISIKRKAPDANSEENVSPKKAHVENGN